jgi:hypothetical protein
MAMRTGQASRLRLIRSALSRGRWCAPVGGRCARAGVSRLDAWSSPAAVGLRVRGRRPDAARAPWARAGRLARNRRATRRRREDVGSDQCRDSGDGNDPSGGGQPAPLRGGQCPPLPVSCALCHSPRALCPSRRQRERGRFGGFSRRRRLDVVTRPRPSLHVVTCRRTSFHVVTRRRTSLHVAWRRRSGRGALQDVLDGLRSLAPEVGGARRHGGLLCERAQLSSVWALGRLIAATRRILVTRRADGHELVAGPEPIDREPHNVRSLSLNVLSLRPFCVHVSQQPPQ